ncbi:hypothetical protein FJ978_07280 [Mesorhizobium sp. B1-1-7]|nr:hypothetical protein FJ978_07280 [Mesorhizobium sp. B1-1-7]
MREILRNSGLTEMGLEPIGLPPESLAGFNPIRHFQEWQATDFLSKEEHVTRVRHAFEEALLCVPEGRGRPKAIANYLNDRSILTIRGNEWNQSNVEKFLMSFSRN